MVSIKYDWTNNLLIKLNKLCFEKLSNSTIIKSREKKYSNTYHCSPVWHITKSIDISESKRTWLTDALWLLSRIGSWVKRWDNCKRLEVMKSMSDAPPDCTTHMSFISILRNIAGLMITAKLAYWGRFPRWLAEIWWIREKSCRKINSRLATAEIDRW